MERWKDRIKRGIFLLYGSLASLFLIVLWLRFIVMILFGGAVLNRLLDDEKTWPYAKKKPGH